MCHHRSIQCGVKNMNISEKSKSVGPRGVVRSNEMEAAFEGSAVHSDRFIITTNQSGVRIAFLESDNITITPRFRSAVLLSYPDAIELSILIRTLLVDVEKQIEDAKAAGAKAENA
jgi:hypothetical protein